jgi:hypothetical protein
LVQIIGYLLPTDKKVGKEKENIFPFGKKSKTEQNTENTRTDT